MDSKYKKYYDEAFKKLIAWWENLPEKDGITVDDTVWLTVL